MEMLWFVKQVKETDSEEEANSLLEKGWILILVYSRKSGHRRFVLGLYRGPALPESYGQYEGEY